MRFAQLQVELRRLGNQLPVLGKDTVIRTAKSATYHYNQGRYDSETVFRNTRSPFDRAMYPFVKLCVVLPGKIRVVSRRCTTVPIVPLLMRKNTNYRFLSFFVRSVTLFRSRMLTPMIDNYTQCNDGNFDCPKIFKKMSSIVNIKIFI